MWVNRKMAAVGAGLAALAGVLAVATPANASHKDGVLDGGELGLYFYQNQGGAVFDLLISDTNFAGDVFPASGASADNNTESWRNRDSFAWRVYTGANYTGSVACVSAGTSGNAAATFRNTVSSAYYLSTSYC